MNYIRIFCPKIMKILMEILHMHRKCWENTESIYLSLYRTSWHDCLCDLEKKAWDLTVVLELFLEIYSAFTQEEIPAEKQVKEILVSYVNDYCQDMVGKSDQRGD